MKRMRDIRITAFVDDLRPRRAGRAPLAADGRKAYREAFEGALRRRRRRDVAVDLLVPRPVHSKNDPGRLGCQYINRSSTCASSSHRSASRS